MATKITHEKRENKQVPLAADTENNNTEEEGRNIILSRSRFLEDETRNKNKNSDKRHKEKQKSTVCSYAYICPYITEDGRKQNRFLPS